MIRLIATDVDGTLVPEGSNVLPEAYYDILRRGKQQGIIFAAASGRQYPSLKKLFLPIQQDMIFIAENGAYVVCRDQEMSCSIIDQKMIELLIRLVRKIDECEICLCARTTTYVESKQQTYIDLLTKNYKNDITRVEDLLSVQDDFIKFSIFHPKDAVKAARATISKAVGTKLEIVCAGQNWLDCMNQTVSKGTALATIQRQLRIKREETLVFGDNENDLSMFAQAEESYAVANAQERIKKAAKHVADRRENNGVLKVLKEWIK